MGARELLGELADIGVSVRADGGNLVIQPAGVITDEHCAELRARKPELLALLQDAVPQAAAPSSTRQATAATSSANRPYRLTPADMAAAHAEPWSEAVTARFLARVAAIQRRGFGERDAEGLDQQGRRAEGRARRGGRAGAHRLQRAQEALGGGG